MEYKKTLNLPQTDFPIRANLGKVEEEMLTYWNGQNIYSQIQDKNAKNKPFILHDGPPYPNGDIHLGHALNKILKDIVVKYKSMQGFHAPFVPGWDCHGLPIETQLLKEIGEKRKEMPISEFREKCRDYALKYVDLQRGEFKKLGVFADWQNPYLTINHSYEENIAALFGVLAEKGYVYRGLKPIHWCPNDTTALAEAEIEYEDDRSPSIFVKFKVVDNKSLVLNRKSPLAKVNDQVFFVVWTTTPWTLPANVAICAHPELEYVFVSTGPPEAENVYVVAEGLLESFLQKLEIKEHKIIERTHGKYLEGILCQHPFIDRQVPVILGELVTLEQGTGLVHIAPGHGAEDYQVGLKYKLPIIMPVDPRGYFDSTVPDWLINIYYDKANKLITEKMKEDGTLLKLEFMKHSYPHCWRCKSPVIFRATEQWFISVDHRELRQEALKAIGQTKWYPAWGENRIRGMVSGRPDWCISRQRAWGVPIPVFYCTKCHKPQMTGIFNQAIRDLFLREGTNGWFAKEAKDILPSGTKCPDCGGSDFTKETDILDVWFESGSSHAAVLETIPGHVWPADLYLEGSDQHRGWFQSSLLLGVGYKGAAPYRAVLTHGFTIDDKGKKMSKSQGNVIDPQDVVKRYGADVLRLWVASTDFRNDMAASESILKQVQEAYLKIRNTCRFLMSNLYDFVPGNRDDSVAGFQANQLLEIDRWILLRLHRLIEKTTKAYDEYELHLIYHSLYDFCVNDLSAFYLDSSKDRLYCGGKDSPERRSAQFAMNEVLKALVCLMAPILSFTAENINKFLMTNECSIFLSTMPNADQKYLDGKLEDKWEIVLGIKKQVNFMLEGSRFKKEIGSSLDADVSILASSNDYPILKSVEDLLPMIFIVSKVSLKQNPSTVIGVTPASGQKCERCWNWRESVGQNKEHPTLCARCAKVVGSL
ncbi:MAG: isoleucine--tRNA ligase [Candidatus Margulisbacteria bacterium]|nr:isoleucine--tRNA ligase [Candidatus Margulisiibacteriota bacterium]MBU1617226.1 isoleucine--tRNA ligase [Candidatus Margulisiibacteriota bacterium]